VGGKYHPSFRIIILNKLSFNIYANSRPSKASWLVCDSLAGEYPVGSSLVANWLKSHVRITFWFPWMRISDEFGEIYFIKSPFFAEIRNSWNRIVYLSLRFQLFRNVVRGVRIRRAYNKFLVCLIILYFLIQSSFFSSKYSGIDFTKSFGKSLKLSI
jgi:hypothetical protein